MNESLDVTTTENLGQIYSGHKDFRAAPGEPPPPSPQNRWKLEVQTEIM